VRGLAYYTGIVFEVFDGGKNMRALAGGGRYDNLTARLGGEQVSGVGFGMGDVVLQNLLEERKLLPAQLKPGVDYWLLSFENNLQALSSYALELREAGRSCNHSLLPQKVKKQMDAANRACAKAVVFLDSDKNTAEEIEIKILASGEQKMIARSALLKGDF
jgi:histidyl-tRNA synthetase